MLVSVLKRFILIYLNLFSFLFVTTNQKSHNNSNSTFCDQIFINCISNQSCFINLNSALSTCGSPDEKCNAKDISMCVYSMKEVRKFLNITNEFYCKCNNIFKTRYICERLRDYIFDHSCNKIIMHYDLINKTNLSMDQNDLSFYGKDKATIKTITSQKHNKRSSTNYNIQELKVQLNDELRRINSISKPIQPQVSCDYALNQICLRHIACHELWNIFRRSCIVDSQNNCRMTSLAHCWQSYEGISWTGLGNCTCYDKNSDCHWIRLQTNYNKCISEIHSRSLANIIYETKPFTTIAPNFLYSTSALPSPRKNVNSQHKIEKITSNNTKYLKTNTHLLDHFNNFGDKEQVLTTITPTKLSFQQPFFGYETLKNSTTAIKGIYNNTNYDVKKNFNKIIDVNKITGTQNVLHTNKKIQHSQMLNRNISKTDAFNNSPNLKQNQLPKKNLKIINYIPESKSNVSKNFQQKEKTTQTSVNTINRNYKSGLTNIRINGQIFNPLQSKNSTYVNVLVNDEEKNLVDKTNQITKNQLYNKTHGISPYNHLSPASTFKSISGNTTKEFNHPVNSSSYDIKKNSNTNNVSPSSFNDRHYQSSNITEKQMLTQNYFKKINEKDMLNKTTYLKKISLSPMSGKSKNINYKSSINDIDNLEKMNVKEENTLNKKSNGMRVDYTNITTLLKIQPAKLSSCQEAFQLCTQDENCQWLFSSVQIKCKSGDINDENTCNRQQCTKAIKNFATYRQREIVEAMMFCQCAPNDKECESIQQWMYPPCLYDLNSSMPNCKEVISSCLKDRSCKHLSKSYFHSCAVSNGSCKPGTYQMNGCRQAVIKLRGSVIDTLCHCEEGDNKCWSHRIELIPLNPCLQKAKDDYAMKGLMPTKASFIPHDVQLSSKQKNKDYNETEKLKLSEMKNVNSSTSTIKNEMLVGNKTLTDNMDNSNDTSILKIAEESNEDTGKIMYDNFTLPTGEYHTQEPPSMEFGCQLRNFNGDWIEVFKGTIFRQYTDWYGRCSNWCECMGNNTQICKELPCLENGVCIHENNVMNFGEKLYIKGRGACTCHMGNFICDTPRDLNIHFQSGLYILAGFSKQELQMFRENVPLEILEKSGLVSDEKMLAKDIASRLQYSLERIMPTGTMCRIIIVEEYLKDEIVILRLQWYGKNIYNKNDTEFGWHVGNLEKICSPYVKQVGRNFLLNMAERYQLVLSSVKQIRVIDLLNELPSVSSGTFLLKNSNVVVSFYFSLILALIRYI